MKQEGALSVNLAENIERFEQLFSGCDDVIRRTMRLGKDIKVECFVAYVEVAVSNMMLEDSVIGKLLNHMWEMSREEIYSYLQHNGLGISDVKELYTMQEVSAAMLAGNAIMFIDGYDRAFKIASKGYPNMGVPEAKEEKVLRGSKEGFSDSVKVNTALIRKRVRDSRLKVKEISTGVRSHTVVAMVYMEDLAPDYLLKKIEEKINSFAIDGVLDSGILEQLMEKTWYSPFPQFLSTERPDRAAMAAMEGRIVIVSDNSPVALILPADYNSFFKTTDDYFNHWELVSFIRLLRYAASVLAVFLPGFYLAAVNYHTQLLPTELLLSFAAARQGVPFPAFVEILFMEVAFELLREAGVRLPGVIGSTIGIVGGLIIGQAAVNANLVSPISVIVVAMTALASFAVPNEEVSSAFRLIKFFMIFLAAGAGLFGLAVGIMLVLIHLSNLTSFGVPYLEPFAGSYKKEKDTLLRMPVFMLKKRPYFAKKERKFRFIRREK